MQMKEHLFEKRIHAKDGTREEEPRGFVEVYLYIQADFQLSKIRRNESTAGSVQTSGTGAGEEEAEEEGA